MSATGLLQHRLHTPRVPTQLGHTGQLDNGADNGAFFTVTGAFPVWSIPHISGTEATLRMMLSLGTNTKFRSEIDCRRTAETIELTRHVKRFRSDLYGVGKSAIEHHREQQNEYGQFRLGVAMPTHAVTRSYYLFYVETHKTLFMSSE